MVGRFDLLFGLTEIESFNILGHEASQTGMPQVRIITLFFVFITLIIDSELYQVDRDHVIRRYLMNRYDKRPEIAFLSTLKEYTNTFLKHKPVSNLDHRDMLLEILSDARVTAPMGESHIRLIKI